MHDEQPALSEAVRLHSVRVLSDRFLVASGLTEQMIRSSHVAGANFIMIDEGCGRIARLMNAYCDQIAGRMAELGSDCDWPARALPDHSYDTAETILLAEHPVDAVFAVALDAFGQSVLEAVRLTSTQGDRPTADLLTSLWRDIDRQLWRHLPRQTAPMQLFLATD